MLNPPPQCQPPSPCSSHHCSLQAAHLPIHKWAQAGWGNQRLLPGLILLYQDHLIPIAGAGKKINRVLDSHIFTGGGDGDTVTILHWLMVCPVCIIWHTCLPCRIGGEISATKITTNQLNVMSKKFDELEREARKKDTL